MPDETGPAAATDQICLLFPAGMGEIEGENTFLIRAGSTWPIFDIAMHSLRGCVSAKGVWGEPPSADTWRLPYVGGHAGDGKLTAGASAENGRNALFVRSAFGA
jgi:hypothetical protein